MQVVLAGLAALLQQTQKRLFPYLDANRFIELFKQFQQAHSGISIQNHGFTSERFVALFSAAQAADSYILLAVGDALVAQIPALLISVAAAMVVSRVGKGNDVGSQITSQVFSSPRSLAIVAGVLCVLGAIPGMPHLVFLMLGSALGYGAWLLREHQAKLKNAPKPPPPPPEANA